MLNKFGLGIGRDDNGQVTLVSDDIKTAIVWVGQDRDKTGRRLGQDRNKTRNRGTNIEKRGWVKNKYNMGLLEALKSFLVVVVVSM